MKDKPFFEELVQYIQGTLHDRKKVMAMVYWGEDAITKVRQIAGSTNPEEADPTTIRGSYGRITTKGLYENVLHTSSNESEAEREIKLWFQPDDIIVDLYPTKVVTMEKAKRNIWA